MAKRKAFLFRKDDDVQERMTRRIEQRECLALQHKHDQGRKCGRVVEDGNPPDICFSRSPNECSRSQNINCLNRSDFYSRTTKYFRLNFQRISAILMNHRLICASV